jgi:hypothetical protein
MANVVCTICGDKGHVAMDCPMANKQHQTENREWKNDAGERMNMEKEYADMMAKMGKISHERGNTRK